MCPIGSNIFLNVSVGKRILDLVTILPKILNLGLLLGWLKIIKMLISLCPRSSVFNIIISDE